jgi:type IV pilus assembly protein PilA
MISSTIQRLNDRRDSVEDSGDDAGFTLIELMVVLLILAILLAIAIPTFLGVTKSANDRAAQSNLNTGLVDAKSAFQTNSQSYNIATNATYTTTSAAMANSLSNAEPNLAFVTSAVTSGSSPAQISVSVATDGNGITLAASAKGSGNCWLVLDNSQTESVALGGAGYTNVPAAQLAPGTWYGEVKNTGTVPTCNSASIPATNVTWSGSGFPNA